MKLTNNQRGFSLVEVMIGVGLLGGVSLGIAKLVDQYQQGQAHMSTSMVTRDLTEEVRATLVNKELCELNLKDLAVDSSPHVITSIKKGSVVSPVEQFTVVPPNNKYYNNQLELLGMSISGYTPLNDTNGMMTLAIRIKKSKKTGTRSESYKKIPIIVKLYSSSDRRISSCYANGGGSGSSGKAVCEGLGGQLYEGATEAQNQCIWSQMIVSKNESLLPDPNSMLRIQTDSNSDGVFDDTWSTFKNGKTYVNYQTSSLPGPHPDTSLYVNGNERVSQSTYSNKVMTSHFTAAPASDFTSMLAYNPLSYNIFRMKNSTGSAGAGEWFGDLWFDGGSDGIVHLTNTGESSSGGTTIARLFDYSTTPYPVSGAINDPALTVANNGNVGIGYSLSSGDAYPFPPLIPNVKLYVRNSATVFGRVYIAGNLYSPQSSWPSDGRWKENIVPLSQSQEAIKNVDGVRFTWKNRPSTEREDIGFIAQDVEKFFPQVIQQDEDGIKSIQYTKLVPVLWHAYREQHEKNQQIRKRLEKLKKYTCLKHPKEKICSNL